MIKKQCIRCKKTKFSDKFCKRKRSKDGFDYYCKKCVRKMKREYKRHPLTKKDKKSNRKSAREHHYKRNYNITIADYDKMFERQDGVCAICGGINSDGRRLAVDHNHKTGKVRQLLCLKCNALIGSVESLGHLLDKAVHYLKIWN